MWSVYFIRSISHPSIVYVGHTSNIEDRLNRHNQGRETYTRKFAPFNLIYTEEFDTKQQAVKREYYFKTPLGRIEKRAIIKRIRGV